MTQPLYRVAYFSRNAIAGTPADMAAEVDTILEIARRNNVQAGLTGALLFNGSCFAQVLEGPLDAMERTFERIQRDPRHADLTVLELGPAEAREFAGWSMAFAGQVEEDRANFAKFAEQALNHDSQTATDFHNLLQSLVLREEAVR